MLAAAPLIPAAVVAGALTLAMAGDPDQMRAAARDWSSEADGASLKEVGTKLKQAVQEVNQNGDWKGSAYNQFIDGQVKTMKEQVEKLDEQRQGVASALNVTAGVYDAASMVSFAVGATLVILSAAVRFLAPTPYGAIALTTAQQIGAQCARVMQNLESLQVKYVWRGALVLGVATTFLGMTSRQLLPLPGSDIKFEQPQFTNARLAYSNTTGLTQGPPDASDFQMPSPPKLYEL